MFDFTPSQRNALIMFSCTLALLLLTAGFLRVTRAGRPLHTLFLQPTPMQPPVPARSTSAPPPSATPTPTQRTGLQTPLALNTASTEELEALPGIGPVLASRITSYRDAHGPFRTPEDLLKVQGIRQETLEKIRPLVTCGPQ